MRRHSHQPSLAFIRPGLAAIPGDRLVPALYCTVATVQYVR